MRAGRKTEGSKRTRTGHGPGIPDRQEGNRRYGFFGAGDRFPGGGLAIVSAKIAKFWVGRHREHTHRPGHLRVGARASKHFPVVPLLSEPPPTARPRRSWRPRGVACARRAHANLFLDAALRAPGHLRRKGHCKWRRPACEFRSEALRASPHIQQ